MIVDFNCPIMAIYLHVLFLTRFVTVYYDIRDIIQQISREMTGHNFNSTKN